MTGVADPGARPDPASPPVKDPRAAEIRKPLIDAAAAGNCVLFLGAGVHAPPGPGSRYVYPEAERPLMAGELAKLLADYCDFSRLYPEEKSLELQRVSLFADTLDGGGRANLVTFLYRHLQQGKQPSPALRALAELPFKVIVTTNYDRLFEAALQRAGKDPQRLVYHRSPNQVTRDLRDDPTVQRPLVFKIHGDIEDRESIVITDEDYITFVQRMSEKDRFHPVPDTVRIALKKWPTLFLGYSLRDYNLRLLFRTLRWGIDESLYAASFSVDYRPDALIRQVYQNEYQLVSFIVEDLWRFVPALYQAVLGRQMPEG